MGGNLHRKKGAVTRRGTVYVLDAAHLLHAAMPSRGWITRTMTVTLTTNSGRNRRTSMGRIRPTTNAAAAGGTGVGCCRAGRACAPAASAGQSRHAPANHAPPVTDAAKARRIERAEYLPPSSPNLNLIERLWKFVGRKVARNRYHATFTAFRAAVQKVLHNLPADRAERASLLTERFQHVTTP